MASFSGHGGPEVVYAHRRRGFGDGPQEGPEAAAGVSSSSSAARGEAAGAFFSGRHSFSEEEKMKKKRRRKAWLPPTHRTLAVMLQALRDETLTFELKDESVVRGTLWDVDKNLNCNLVAATVERRDGSRKVFETTYVNGSMVRYVRFPDDVDAARSLDQYLDARARSKRASERTKRPALVRDAASVPAPIDLGGHAVPLKDDPLR